jgi:phage tail-like protein
MATFRERPYSAFNYLVTIGDADPEQPQAGFQEVSGLSIEVNTQEYRAGNAKQNTPIKITGLHSVPDVTLRRGLIGDLDLITWLDAVRSGKQGEQLRKVVIELKSEDRESTVQSWTLHEARPIRYTGPSLSGSSSDVAVEEIVLAVERIEIS